jgi:hypothetical protein
MYVEKHYNPLLFRMPKIEKLCETKLFVINLLYAMRAACLLVGLGFALRMRGFVIQNIFRVSPHSFNAPSREFCTFEMEAESRPTPRSQIECA